MAFMQRQVEFGSWHLVETVRDGTESIPADLFDGTVKGAEGFFGPGNVLSVDTVTGWGCRLSAPGYMDCTPWDVFDTEQEAINYLDACYGEED